MAAHRPRAWRAIEARRGKDRWDLKLRNHKKCTCGSSFFSTSSLLLLKCRLLRLKPPFKPEFVFHFNTLTLLFPCTDSRHVRERSLEVQSCKTKLTALWFHLDLTSERSHNFNRQLLHRHQTITHSGACSRQKTIHLANCSSLQVMSSFFSGNWRQH